MPVMGTGTRQSLAVIGKKGTDTQVSFWSPGPQVLCKIQAGPGKLRTSPAPTMNLAHRNKATAILFWKEKCDTSVKGLHGGAGTLRKIWHPRPCTWHKVAAHHQGFQCCVVLCKNNTSVKPLSRLTQSPVLMSHQKTMLAISGGKIVVNLCCCSTCDIQHLVKK